jgi:hypothetical protein
MKAYLDDREELVAAQELDEAGGVLSSEPLTLSPTASRALARRATAILREADPSFSREDVTRTDFVHAKVRRTTLRKADILLEDEQRDGGSQAANLEENYEESVADIEAAAAKEFERAERFIEGEEKDYFSYHSTIAQAEELQALARNIQRRVIQNHSLFGDRLEAALARNDLQSAEAQLLEAINSPHADYALQVTCVRALIEIQSLRPCEEEPLRPFDGKWLAARAGLKSWTAQRLLNDARKEESGVAAILIGTAWGGRKQLRDLLDAAPSRRREVVNAVRACVTKYVLEHEIKVNENRRRKLSITDLRVLDFIGLNIGPIREELADMQSDLAVKWLASKLDEYVERLETYKRQDKRTRESIASMKSDLKSRTREAA